MYIESIEEIDEVRLSFSAKFRLILSWFDKRLRFNNLNEDSFLNLPTADDTRRIWNPVLIFENTKNNYRTVVDEQAKFL